MPYFLRSLGLALITVSTIAGPAHAGQIKPFERQAFTTAQQNGKRVMIIVSSPMNPLSEEQKPILDRISRDFLYPDVLFFNVDFNAASSVDTLASSCFSRSDLISATNLLSCSCQLLSLFAS